MKIKLFGYLGQLSPIPLFRTAFTELGHEVIDNGEPDLIYDTTGGADGFMEYKAQYPRAKTISTLLNADINNPNWEAEKFGRIMKSVDVAVTVSESTKKDIKDRIGVDCKVIYFPMREVKPLNLEYRGIDFIYIGRLYNPEKRFNIIKPALLSLNYPYQNLVVVGPERVDGPYCTGFIADEDLNVILNSARFTLCPCWHEGSMSMLEAVVCGSFPICCTDNEWTYEFGLQDFAAEPSPTGIAKKIFDINQDIKGYKDKLNALIPNIKEKCDKINVAKRVIDLYNSL